MFRFGNQFFSLPSPVIFCTILMDFLASNGLLFHWQSYNQLFHIYILSVDQQYWFPFFPYFKETNKFIRHRRVK
jgi:hypothetical protein